MMMLSAKTATSERGCLQVFCFSVGEQSLSEIVNFFLFSSDCSGGSGRPGGLSWTTTCGGSGRLPLKVAESLGLKSY